MANENISTSLKNASLFLGIILTLASVIGAACIAYDTGKETKLEVASLKVRMQASETKQARFEGIIDERTKNTAKRVDDIYNIVKEWEAK